MKKILIEDTLENPGKVYLQIENIETQSVPSPLSKETIDKEFGNTATYVDTYEKMTEFTGKLGLAKAFDGKHGEEFFKDHTLVFCIASSTSGFGMIQSAAAENGVLSVNILGADAMYENPLFHYMILDFSREDTSANKITAAQYNQLPTNTIGSEELNMYSAGLDSNDGKGSYEWIDSVEKLDSVLADPSHVFTDEKNKDEIKSKYDSEFFKTNNLLVYNGNIECPEVYVRYDDKNVYVAIYTDYCIKNKLLFIGMPSVNGKDKKTVFDISEKSGVDKPVIYLYPEEETEVSVSVDLNGNFRCVYPEFTDEEKSMWTVTASPDGLLKTEDGSEYNYLFWEGIQDVDWDMSKGFVVKGSDTLSFLRDQLPKMGLTPKEYNDFIVYWLPQMQNNEYNYITFQTDRYTDNAVLTVTPEADSVLRVFMAYTPVDKQEADMLSKTVKEPEFDTFERNGFTVVEWGGCRINK